MTTYYLSGPMTGLPDLNYPAFRTAALGLRALGHTVYNPADWERCNPRGGLNESINTRPFNLHDAFADYTRFIIFEADAVIALPGWRNSPGATAEVALARALGKEVHFWIDGAVHYSEASSAEQIKTLDPDGPEWTEEQSEAYARASMGATTNPPPCPDHVERQHRDGKPPWCPRCGWTHGRTATGPVKHGSSRLERDMARATVTRDMDLP